MTSPAFWIGFGALLIHTAAFAVENVPRENLLPSQPKAGVDVQAAKSGLLLSQLDNPQTKDVILTITGDIKHANQMADGASSAKPSAYFSLGMLQALPQHTIKTQSPWVDKPHSYKGPRVSDLLQLVEGQGKYITLTALNDFQVKVDWDLIKKFEPILAWEDDGKVMTRRGKGPLWLILPLDEAGLRGNQYHDAMVWQLKQLQISR